MGRPYVAIFLLAEGLATLFAPDSSLGAPSLVDFFGTIPRWVWGLVQVGAALMLALPAWGVGGNHRAKMTYPAILVCLAWAGVVGHPLWKSEPWNIIHAIAWLFLAFVTWYLCFPGAKTRMRRLSTLLKVRLDDT